MTRSRWFRWIPAALVALHPVAAHGVDVAPEPLLADAGSTRGGVLGAVAGGVLGAGVGYATGFLATFATSTCDVQEGDDRTWGCGEPLDDAIRGTLIFGPLGAVVGAAGGVVTARAAQRGRPLPVLLGATGTVALGQGLIWLAMANDQHGSPPLALGGAVVTLVGTPLAAGALGGRPVAVAPTAGHPGLQVSLAW